MVLSGLSKDYPCCTEEDSSCSQSISVIIFMLNKRYPGRKHAVFSHSICLTLYFIFMSTVMQIRTWITQIEVKS